MGSIKVTLPNWSSQFSTQILKDTQVPANYVKLTLEVYMHIYINTGREEERQTWRQMEKLFIVYCHIAISLYSTASEYMYI